MRLIYSLPFFPYAYTPWLFREMAWMRQRGHEIAVISLGDPPGPSADLREFKLDDVPVLQLRMRHTSDARLLRELVTLGAGWFAPSPSSLAALRKQKGLRQGVHEWQTLKRAAAFVRRFRADVIEAHWAAHSAALARDLLHATGIPYALRMHGGDLHTNPSPNLQMLVESAAAVCPVSRFLADLLLGQRPLPNLPRVPPVSFDLKKLRICHNGVPADAISAEPAPQSDDLQIIGTIGRLDPPKRHGELVTAVARLAPKHPGLRLLIIGGGVLEEELKKQAADLGIADRVTVTGLLSWDKVIEARKQLHIYAHTSQLEGCSLAVAEGLAQGVPGLLTRVGAAVDSIEEGVNGYTVAVGDVDAITASLDKLVSAGAAARREMGAVSIRIIRERFEFDGVMTRLEGILNAAARGEALPA